MPSAAELALVERKFISNFSVAVMGIQIYANGMPATADGDVTATVVNEASEEVLVTTADYQADTNSYEITLNTQQTAVPGLYLIFWDYEMAAVAQTKETYYEVMQPAPAYDALPDQMKQVVENVYWRFADLYDSPLGGPHLQVHVQTNFGRQRMAQALTAALGRINIWAQPHQTYVVDASQGGKEFPLAQWGGLLELATYIEVIKHLRRSYIEQPDLVGANLARLDRSSYIQRWEALLRDEQSELSNLIDQFKIAHLGLGRPSVLVSGGAYGSWGPFRSVAGIAARPNLWRVH